jgi:hypothetical protein
MQDAIMWLRDTARKDPKVTFKRVLICTSNPAIPWELLVINEQHEPDGLGFLGTEVAVARWHLRSSITSLPAPPEQVMLRELAVIRAAL